MRPRLLQAWVPFLGARGWGLLPGPTPLFPPGPADVLRQEDSWCVQPLPGSPFQNQPQGAPGRRGLRPGIPRPRRNLGQKCSEPLLGTEAWVLPLRPPSPQGSGGTSQELTQDGGAPCTHGSSEPQAQALLPGGAHCGQDGSAARLSPYIMVPAVLPGEVWKQGRTMSSWPPGEEWTVGGPQKEKALESQKQGSFSLCFYL